jgi:hypothetical protein
MKRNCVKMLLLMTALAGCQKEGNQESPVLTSALKVKGGLLQHAVRMNAGNDTIGIHHNLALNAVVSYSRENGGINLDDCVIFLDEYYRTPLLANRAEIVNSVHSLKGNTLNDFEKIIARLPFSVDSKQLVSSVLNAIRASPSMDAHVINARLDAIEGIAKTRVKDKELSIILQLISISKHSSNFWITRYGDQPLPGPERLWKVLAAIHADNCGFLIGIIFGDPEFGAALFSASVGFGINDDNRVDI